MSSIYEIYDDEGTVSFHCTGDAAVDDAIAEIVERDQKEQRTRNLRPVRPFGAQPDYDLWT